MRNGKEKDVDWGVGRVRREVVRGEEGASVNADSSSLKLPYTATAADPLSELVWSPHTGLTLKSANSEADLRKKPLLLWNVGVPAGDQDDHFIIHPAASHNYKGKELAAAIASSGWDIEDKKGMKKRKQIDGSGFVMKPNKSFMKWISNITKQDESKKIGESIQEEEIMKSKGKEAMIGSEAMACVFERRLDALRNIKWGGIQRCFFCGGCHHVRDCPSVTKSQVEDVLLKLKNKKKRSSSPTKQVNEEMMFDAIRKLRLSRADIIRWMNSEGGNGISHLKGFFVRLRMGNKEATTCYYVACITGDDDVTQNKCIWVDVGGIKSCVATQYVSNHHFLQDEIKGWWNRSLRSGCTLPSLADLNSKFNQRQTFGF